MEKIELNGKVYIAEEDVKSKEMAQNYDDMPYVIVRTYSAGVFAGYLEKRNEKVGTVRKARRLWYWDGASSLSQLAVDGTCKPENCKFPCEVEKVELTEIIEVDYCTEKAKKSIQEVKVWEQK